MTRETKIGIAVAVSFLCLVGVVVATKWLGRGGDPNAVAENGGPKGKPNEVKGENPPQSPSVVNAQHVEGANPPNNAPANNAPTNNSPGNNNANPPVVDPSLPSLPAVPALPVINNAELPPVPTPTEQNRKALLTEIEQQNNQPLPPPPMLPTNVFNKPNEPMNSAPIGSENKNVFAPANNQPLPVVKNDTFPKVNGDGFTRLPDIVEKPNEGPEKKSASEAFDSVLNKGNDTANKGLDNLNKGLDNANKNLPLPLPPVAANPMAPAPPMANNNNNNNPLANVEAPQQPMFPTQVNPNLPAVPNNNNPLANNNNNNNNPLPNNNNPLSTNNNNNSFPRVDEPRTVIPAPVNQNLPAITNSNNNNNNNNNSGFTIPAPGKASDVKVTNYDAQSYVARPGDSFASLGKSVYGSETFGNALLAFNRDYNREYNPNAATLQGQKVMFPSRQFLQDRYSNAVADNRPAAFGNGGGISINQPVPVIPRNVPAPATSDVTKSYRVPATGQPIYQLAIDTLGDGGRWTEIYRLNPNIDPLQPIPGGSVVRLPVNARVP